MFVNICVFIVFSYYIFHGHNSGGWVVNQIEEESKDYFETIKKIVGALFLTKNWIFYQNRV